jgi:hypothetical protein
MADQTKRLALTPNTCERGQARRDLHLHVDGAGFDALKSYGGNALNHERPQVPNSTNVSDQQLNPT